MTRAAGGARTRGAVTAIALALIAISGLVALVQSWAVSGERFVGWLGMVPLLASLALGWRGVAAAAVYSLLLAAVLTLGQSRGSVLGEVARISVVAGLGSFAVLNSVVRQRQETRLREVDEVARTAQAALRQTPPVRTRRWHLASRCRSAAAGAEIGGDVLEVAETATGVRALVGDVSGRGLPSVRLAAITAMSFREACGQRNLPLVEVARRIDQAVHREARDEEFVTAVLLDLDDSGWLQVVNCGHPPPLRLTAAGELQPLSPTVATTPLALDPAPRGDTYCVTPGDRLLLYTGGLLEARNEAGESFPLRGHTSLLTGADLQAAVDGLLAAVDRHADGQSADDITLLLLGCAPPSAAAHSAGGAAAGTVPDPPRPDSGGSGVHHA